MSMTTAGLCRVCGIYADRLFGGGGRYVVMCLGCWLKPEPHEAESPAATEDSFAETPGPASNEEEICSSPERLTT